VLLLLLWLVFAYTTYYAYDQQEAWQRLNLVSKIFLMSVVAACALQDTKRLRFMLLATALSIGILGVKGGLFGIATAGQHRVFGPPDSFIADNNAFALACLMAMPLLLGFARQEANRRLRLAWYGAAGLTMLSVLLTYSRGALLGAIVLVMLLVLTSRRKYAAALVGAITVVAAMAFVPEHWFERMESIGAYQEDRSAMSRLNQWMFAINLAWEYPLTGGGFGAFDRDLFLRYAPEPDDVYNGHSIYFQILGEHGFLGLGVFMALLVAALLSLRRLRRIAPGVPEIPQLADYAQMLQLAIVAYAVSGAFLPLAYFDLYYYLIVGVIVLKTLTMRALAARAWAEAQGPADEEGEGGGAPVEPDPADGAVPAGGVGVATGREPPWAGRG
jgi:probable O-glycosylation ligase (exosortase A-associated)